MNKTIRCILVSITLFFYSSHCLAGACQVISSICVEGPETRAISGMSFYRDCWNYQDTFQCIDEPGFDYCAAIDRTQGCQRISQSLSADRKVYTNTYTCGSQIYNTNNIIVLNDTYTIVGEYERRDACQSLSNNPSCRLANRICVEGAATRVINGLNVYRDCWAWNEQYTCQTVNPVNYCTPLIVSGNCELTESTCATTSPLDGMCIAYEDKYDCREKKNLPLPQNVTHLNTGYSIVKDELVDECESKERSPYCQRANDYCAEGPEVRNIDGLDVYKECWRWEREYVCLQDEVESDCAGLENNPDCSESDRKCVIELEDGRCSVMDREFKCLTGTPVVQTITNCGSRRFCINGSCYDTGYPPDTDFGRVIAMMEMVNEFSYGLFKGDAHDCASEKLWGLKNCCKTNSAMAGATDNSMMNQVMNIAGETVSYLGSRYLYSGSSAVGGQYLNWITSTFTTPSSLWIGQAPMGSVVQGGILPLIYNYATTGVLSGSFSAFGMTFGFGVDGAMVVQAAADAGWGTVVAEIGGGASAGGLSIAICIPCIIVLVIIMIIMTLLECDEEEFILGAKRSQGLCHKVGSWCEDKGIFGECIERREGWCCFTSKLARIVQQQGRAQIGKSWGNPKHPDCSGFINEEFLRINFDQIDLSEFIGDIMRAMPSGKTESRALERASELGNYYSNNPPTQSDGTGQ